ncbi:class I SAM-dependent methyltransferase [Paraburkholderia caribensis]|nr:class I SAM-dependent methyltransferase [Paraburkholderia caribensis]
MTSPSPHLQQLFLSLVTMPTIHPIRSNDVRFVRDYGLRVIELLAPVPGETILDLGCGDGDLSVLLQERGAKVVGVDIDEAAVSAARARGVDAFVQDGQSLQFPAEFDAVFSHASIHWMPQVDQVFAGVWRALKSGGRFVAETGSHRNIAAIHTAMIATLLHFGVSDEKIPRFYYPAADECCDLLEASGFSVIAFQTFPCPTPLPRGMRAWFEMFGKPFFQPIAEAHRDEAMAYAEHLLQPVLRTGRGDWIADYVHLRFKAKKKSD